MLALGSPAPFRFRSIVPSLLIVLLWHACSAASSGDKPLDLRFRPLNPRNAPPMWVNPIDTIWVSRSERVEQHLVAVDADVGQPLTLHLITSQSFLSLVDSGNGRGLLTAAPPPSVVGGFSAQVIVSDDSLAADTMNFTLLVLNTNRPPAWNDPGIDTIFIVEGKTWGIRLTVSDPDRDIVQPTTECELAAGLAFAGSSMYDLTVAPQYGQVGDYTLRLIARDHLNADTLIFVVRVLPALPNYPPRFLRLDSDSTYMLEGGYKALQVEVTDIDGDVVSLRHESTILVALSDLGFGLFEVGLAPAVGQIGRHIVRLIASDGRDEDSLLLTVQVGYHPNRNHPPQLIDIPAEIELLNFRGDTTVTLRAIDSDGDDLVFTAVHLQEFMALVQRMEPSGGEALADLVISPGATNLGVYSIGIYVSDGELSDTASLLIGIGYTNFWPEIGELPARSMSEGDSLEVKIIASDLNTTVVTLTAFGMPPNATFIDHRNNQGTFRFAPNYQQSGEYTVGFIADDGLLRDTALLHITVENRPAPPQLAVVTPRTVNEGSTIRIPILATHPENRPITLSAYDLPANASFVDSGNGRGGITFSPAIGQIGPFEMRVVATSDHLSDTGLVLVTVLQVSQPPDTFAAVQFVSEEVARFETPFTIDQVHVEDLDLDGVEEVLFRESTEGGHRLQIWSASTNSLWALPGVGMGIKSYTLRSGDGRIEPVVWTQDNRLLGLDADNAEWVLLAQVPDSATRIQWLPENSYGGLALITLGEESSGYVTNPVNCTSYEYNVTSRAIVLGPNGLGARWQKLGYAQVKDFAFGSMLPVFEDGVQSDLLVFSYDYDLSLEVWGNCGMPHEFHHKSFSLYSFLSGDPAPIELHKALNYSCQSPWCDPIPNHYLKVVGLTRWHEAGASGPTYVFVDGPAVPVEETADRPYTLNVLRRGAQWSKSNYRFNLPVAPSSGGAITVEGDNTEQLLLCGDAGLGYIVSLPNATIQGRMIIPAARRFKTGYVIDSSNRDMIAPGANSLTIFRVKSYTPPRENAQLHRVPSDYPTIQAAINAALSGDTILVSAGEYPGNITYLGKNLCLKSESGPDLTHILSASATLPVVRIAAGETESAILDGFTIRSGTVGFVDIANGARPVIRNNIFRDLQGSRDIISVKSHGALITRNLFVRNATARCIAVESNGSARIVNNTLDGNGRGVYSVTALTELTNNIITRHSGFGVNGRFGAADFNNIWQNNPDYDPRYQFTTSPGLHDISIDPLFRDAVNLDYRILVESRCVDAGNPDPAYRDSDGTRADIGALAPHPGIARPADLRVSGEEPFHVRQTIPEFTWDVLSPTPFEQQSFHLQVGVDDDWTNPDLWDHGPVTGPQTVVLYAGSPLERGHDYYVRLRLSHAGSWTSWLYSRFRVNSVPPTPQPLAPVGDRAVKHDAASLIALGVIDPDGDTVSYDYEVFTDSLMTSTPQAWSGIRAIDTLAASPVLQDLAIGERYWWRVRASDGFEASDWSRLSSFRAEVSPVVRVPQDQPTIQLGIYAAEDGDTVEVSPGLFAENLIIDGKYITLRSSSGPDSSFVVAADTLRQTLKVISAAGERVRIEGLSFLSGRWTPAILCEGGSPWIRDCKVQGSPTPSPPRCGGITLTATTDAVVEMCELSQTRYPAPGAIALLNSQSALIRYNLFVRNSANNLIYLDESSASIRNNSLIGASYGIDVKDGATADIRNNIFMSMSSYAIHGPGQSYAGIFQDYNCFFLSPGGTRDYDPVAPHNLFAYPGFVDTLAEVYRLTALSRCIDAGDPEGHPDPDGSRADIGAFPLGGRDGEPHLRLEVSTPSRVTSGPTVFNWGGFVSESQQQAVQLELDDDEDWTDAPLWTADLSGYGDTALLYTGPVLANSNTYHYRLRVLFDEWSEWVSSTFYVNAAPTSPALAEPANGATVPTAAIKCSFAAATDPDLDPLKYHFGLYADPGLSILLLLDTLSTREMFLGTFSNVILESDQSYWWRVRATDGWDVSDWSPSFSFETRPPLRVSVPGEYATIPSAIDAVDNGDSIVVGPGLYPGGFSYAGKLVFIRSEAGPANTVIDLDSTGLGFIKVASGGFSGGSLEGFTVRGGTGEAAVNSSGADIVIHGNRFVGFRGTTSVIRAGSQGQTIIRRNVFWGNGGKECIGLHFLPARIENNTIYYHRAGIFTHHADAKVFNNIVVGCTTYAIWGTFDSAGYNLLWNNLPYDGHGYETGASDVLADPQFVDPANGDFRLNQGSPCIDAGHPDPPYNDPDGSRNDIGAIPFSPGVATAAVSDDLNGDGLVDIRDAVLLIDRTVRKRHPGEEGTSALQKVRMIIARVWGRAADPHE